MNSSENQSIVDNDSATIRRRYRWVLLVAVLALWATFGIYIHLCRQQTNGHLTYAIDDAYISMAIAKNFSQTGTWGIEPGHFASLASSIAWIYLLTGVFKVAGTVEWAALALNIVFATLLFALIWSILRGFRVSPAGTLLGLLLVMALMPLVPVAFTGLEHILQTCVDLAYIFAVANYLGEETTPGQKRAGLGVLLGLSPVLTLVRYEGGFLVAVAACLLLARKRVLAAALTGVLGFLPVLLGGLVFLSKGWFFLPTTLIQKGNYPKSIAPLHYLFNLARALVDNLHAIGGHMSILIGLVLLGTLLWRGPLLTSRLGVMVLLFLGTIFIHLTVAQLGWFYRYEAYLVCIGLVVFVSLTAQLSWQSALFPASAWRWLRAIPLAAALALLMAPMLDRAVTAYARTPLASRNIWEQQCHMGQFLHTYYEGASVAANDIGAINFFADIRCFDVMGLADATVTRLIVAHQYDAAAIGELARKRSVKIAVVYDSWLKNYFGGVPEEWRKAGDWTTTDNVFDGPMVSFYAVDPEELPSLRGHLQAFNSQLPKTVEVDITH